MTNLKLTYQCSIEHNYHYVTNNETNLTLVNWIYPQLCRKNRNYRNLAQANLIVHTFGTLMKGGIANKLGVGEGGTKLVYTSLFQFDLTVTM